MHVYLSVLVTALTMSYVSGIKCGNTDLALTARVIQLWSVPDCTNPAEEGSLHMLLLDEKVFSPCSFDFCWLNWIISLGYAIHVI